MSSFSGLQIGLSGLRAQQVVQETISQNVANINTAGYSRQEVRLVSVPPADPAAVIPQAGNGVAVADIRRSASVLLNQQIQREGSGRSYWQTVRDGMGQVEGLFQEPGPQGLEALTNTFWNAWHDLSIDPTNSAARTNVRQAADTLATNIQHNYRNVVDFSTGLDDQLRLQVQRVNVLADEVATINSKIGQAAGAGNPANDLRDQRDVLLEKLSKLARIHSAENSDGRVFVALGGHTLVGAHGATAMLVEPDGTGDQQPVWADDHSTVTVREGAIGGTLALRDWARDQVLSGLNTFAGQLIQAVNVLHQSGYTPDNRTGIAFFAGSDAHDIRVSDEVAGDLNAIAVAAGPDAPGDGSVALQITDLQRTKISALNDSLGGFYAAYIAQVGLDTQKSDQMASNQDALMRFLDTRRENIAGVSLDEEAVKMLGAQHAYQASARVITAVDEMLDKMINDMGLVGR